jgi:2-polyprenyl-3-methyl-5-hydroxy-6-metoxy-1,4-benzoquinol methylase
MTTPHLSLDQMKDTMRAPWIAGDFGAIAREIGAPEAERFVALIGLEPGARVLDIACGTGNVTIPLARRGARVTGLDMTPHLLEEARARAAREGLRIRFDAGVHYEKEFIIRRQRCWGPPVGNRKYLDPARQAERRRPARLAH